MLQQAAFNVEAASGHKEMVRIVLSSMRLWKAQSRGRRQQWRTSTSIRWRTSEIRCWTWRWRATSWIKCWPGITIWTMMRISSKTSSWSSRRRSTSRRRNKSRSLPNNNNSKRIAWTSTLSSSDLARLFDLDMELMMWCDQCLREVRNMSSMTRLESIFGVYFINSSMHFPSRSIRYPLNLKFGNSLASLSWANCMCLVCNSTSFLGLTSG